MQFGYNSMMVAVVFLVAPAVYFLSSIFVGIVVDRFVSSAITQLFSLEFECPKELIILPIRAIIDTSFSLV